MNQNPQNNRTLEASPNQVNDQTNDQLNNQPNHHQPTQPFEDAQLSQPTQLPPPPTPKLDDIALHGPAGHIVRLLTPHTEAHPAALLLQLLAAFGNLIGPGPHCMVESTRHALNLFVVLVGDSSKARKGTSWNLIANLFAGVDQPWRDHCVNHSRLTAEGLLRALRDQDPPTERRLLALSEEFAAVLHSLKRGRGHISSLLRCAWDNGDLPTLDMNRSLRSTGTHLSLIAHITQQELTSSFHHHQVHNGFANRCLWTWVERAQCLPDGGSPPAKELAEAAAQIRRAAVLATSNPPICFRRDEEAAALWTRYYPSLSFHEAGMRGAATSRGEAQVLRLSALYAALDCTDLITADHLYAALAVWDYCYQTATYLFGFSTGDVIADRIREAAEAAPDGLTKFQINRLFHSHIDPTRIDAALQNLTAKKALYSYSQPTGGRPTTVWLSAPLRKPIYGAE
jgi:Protein of unknown function (DUF3987)